MLLLSLLLLLFATTTAVAEFVSKLRADDDRNCTETEYSYATRCICTWICANEVERQSGNCEWTTNPCGTLDQPYCIGSGTDKQCVASDKVDSTGLDKCVPNAMIENNHCICGKSICATSIFSIAPTLELVVLNYCSTDLECIRNDFGSYSVFPYNGGITGADPSA